MATLTAWKFAPPRGAENAQLHDTTKAGAMSGGFWGTPGTSALFALTSGAFGLEA
jgi:uncharacterized membrane protein